MEVIIHGCLGKMGTAVAESVMGSPNASIAFGIDKGVSRRDDTLMGNDHKEVISNFPIFSLLDSPEKGDVIIDFSSPGAMIDLLKFAEERRLPMVLATTGLSLEEQDAVNRAALEIPIFQSPNFSIGINLLASVVELVMPVLEQEFDVGIIDKHHREKRDSPSGTAILLGKTVENASRHGKKAEIVSLRIGTIPGEHTVVFAGPGEVIELKHTAQSRQIFAQGAVKAAEYLLGKPPGLYTMAHMLKGLENA